MLLATPSSRGLGHWPFTPATRVRIPLGSPFFLGQQGFREHTYISPPFSPPIWSDTAYRGDGLPPSDDSREQIDIII